MLNSFNDRFRGKRKSTIDADREQLLFWCICFENEERAKLCVAILLDDVTERMLRDELFDLFTEREAPDAHVIGMDAFRIQQIDRFVARGIAAADTDDAKRRAIFLLDDRRWNI